LGREVGNANEIKESVDVLRGQGPDDVTELTFALAEVMLELASIDGGRERLEETIASGAAFQKLKDVTAAHGGDTSVLDDTSLLETAAQEAVITAPVDGFVTRCDALTIGLAATRLGAGRERKEDDIDCGVGITLEAKIGDRVARGDILAVVRFNDQAKWDGQKDRLASAWSIDMKAPHPHDLVVERIDSSQI